MKKVKTALFGAYIFALTLGVCHIFGWFLITTFEPNINLQRNELVLTTLFGAFFLMLTTGMLISFYWVGKHYTKKT